MNHEPSEAALEALRAEHRDLDARIAALVAEPAGNQLDLARLKRTKLRLKDEIAFMEDALVPDILA